MKLFNGIVLCVASRAIFPSVYATYIYMKRDDNIVPQSIEIGIRSTQTDVL